MRAELPEGKPELDPTRCVGEVAPGEEMLDLTGELRAVDVDCGALNCCAVLNDKTVRCWGDNSEGQLGDGTHEDRARPVVVAGLPHERPYPVEIAVGYTVCARMSDGTVWCWGENFYGQLGDGTTQSRPTPERVHDLKDATQIAMGRTVACALVVDGTVRCWGYGRATGVPSTPTQSSDFDHIPRQVVGLSEAIQIEAGGDLTCARLRDRTLQCWGFNSWGQLGNGSTRDLIDRPSAVPGLKGVADLALRSDHTCALTDDRQVFCWGRNEECQAGVGVEGRDEVTTPTLVRGVLDVVEIAVSSTHSCARTCNGTVLCWGFLFSPDTQQRVERCALEEVPALPPVAQLAPGSNSTCVRSTEGAVLCWGVNVEGVLGNGTFESRSYAARIQW